MDKIAEIIANYVINKGTVKEEDRIMYEYGFLITLETIFCVIVCLGISIVLHTIPEGILFFVIFVPLRSYAGGLHLDNYWSCFSLSCLTFLVIMLASKYLEFPIGLNLGILLLLELTIYKMYPVENVNREVDADENKYFKKKMLQFLLLDSVIAFICMVFNMSTYLQVIALTFLMITITMAIGKCKNMCSSFNEE